MIRSTAPHRRPRVLARVLTAALLVGAAAACTAASDDELAGDGAPAAPGVPTYRADIAPLLAAHCTTCHRGGGLSPYPLDTFALARETAPLLRQVIEARVMPPWPAAQACASVRHSLALDERELGLVRAWIAAGTPEGNGPRTRSPVVSSGPSRVDLALALPTFTPSGASTNPLRCFVVPWPLARTAYVTGFGVGVGRDARMVHGVVAYLPRGADADAARALDAADAAPGYACSGGAGVDRPDWLGAWAPGDEGDDYPDGTGIRVEPGAAVVVQVRYEVSYEGVRPVGDVALRLRVGESVEHEARWIPWTRDAWTRDESFVIPRYARRTFEETAAPGPMLGAGPFVVRGVGVQMNGLGASASLGVVHADGTNDCLLSVPSWNVTWQRFYFLDAPRAVGADDRLRLRCAYDNTFSSGSHGEFSSPVVARWGEGPRDEQCLAALYVTAR